MSREEQLALKKAEYEGKVFKTNNYGNVEVVEYLGSNNITVKFLNTGSIKTTTVSALKTGSLKDSEIHDTSKYGIMDLPKSVGRGDKRDPLYYKWKDVMQRCYNPKRKVGSPTYEDCTSSETFRYFSKFKSWYYSQIGCDQGDWHLDKDILVKGNKIYSEDTCCIVPPEINCAVTKNKSVRGQFPQGVIYNCTKTRYRARIQRGDKCESLGTYDTPEEVFYAYKPVKEAYIKSLAEKWKDEIDPRVYDALMAWEISIDD